MWIWVLSQADARIRTADPFITSFTVIPVNSDLQAHLGPTRGQHDHLEPTLGSAAIASAAYSQRLTKRGTRRRQGMPPPKGCLTSILGRQGQHNCTNYSSSLHGQSGIGEKLHAAHGPVRCPRRTRGKAEILSAMGRAPDPCARASGKSRNRAGAIPSRRLSVTIVISSVTAQTGGRGGHGDRDV